MLLLVFGCYVCAHLDGHQYGVSIQISLNLGKYFSPGPYISPLAHKKNCRDLKLGESHCIFTLFLFPDSGLTVLNGFGFFILISF